MVLWPVNKNVTTPEAAAAASADTPAESHNRHAPSWHFVGIRPETGFITWIEQSVTACAAAGPNPVLYHPFDQLLRGVVPDLRS